MDMKIVAGLADTEYLERFAEAGADEVFVGYVPQEWQLRYGLYSPLNRREVCYYNVQIGSDTQLRILRKTADRCGVNVTITLNSLQYRPEQYAVIADIIEHCAELGFTSFIIADHALMVYLKYCREINGLHFQVSGEFGEMNSYVLQELYDLGAERVILHRKLSPAEMKYLIESKSGLSQYEAFVLNELCHFHGGYCNSLHCDELIPMCRMPYRFSGADISGSGIAEATDPEFLGAGGCGLCALWKLMEAGITHLKIVGRGAHAENMLRDITALKSALKILRDSLSEGVFQKKMADALFPEGCSKNCYYL